MAKVTEDFRELNEESDDSLTTSLITTLSPKKTNRYKKALFELYNIINNSFIKGSFISLINLASYLGLCMKQLQFQSLILLSRAKKNPLSYDSSISQYLNYIRFDQVFIKYFSQTSFTFYSLVIIFGLSFLFLVVYFQLLIKKNIILKPLIVLINAITCTLENYFMIPLVNYASVYIMHAWFVTDTYAEAYELNLEFDSRLAILFVLELALLFILLYFNTIFNYSSSYTSKSSYSRSNSLITVKQVIFFFIVTILNVIFSSTYFLELCIVIGLYMVYNYVYYIPYYSILENTIDSGLWLILTASSILALINDFSSTGFETVLCLLILSPFLYFLLYSFIKKNLLVKETYTEDSPYTFEIKIRKLCYGKKELSQETIELIREMFKDSTKKFLEFKMIFIWECNFELSYGQNHDLAMMKLLKIVFTDKRPKFLEPSKIIFKSFPNIECEYWFYYTFKQICSINTFKDLTLLKYLKNFSKSNDLDADACYRLLDFIDANLESAKNPPAEISQKCKKFITAVDEKDRIFNKYSKIEVNHSDNITKYQNFTSQLFDDMQHGSQTLTDKKRESFLNKLIGVSSESSAPVIIISGYPDAIGTIIYLNQEAVLLLKADSAVELLGVNFCKIIPPPFDVLHKNILEKFLLFGNHTEMKRPHLIVLDMKGYCIEITMQFRLAFYAQVPYFIINLLPKLPKECMILCSPEGRLYTFSRELTEVITSEIYYIQQIFPNILEYFSQYENNESFIYSENGKHDLLKRVEVEIDGVKLNVIYLYEDQSSFNFYYNKEEEFQQLNKQVTLSNLKSIEYDKVLLSRPSFNKRKKRNLEEKAKKPSKSISVDNSEKIKKLVRYLMNLNLVAMVALIAVILSLTIFELNYSDTATLCYIMDDLGRMRYSILSIVSSVRSIELYRMNYPTGRGFEDYRGTLINSTALLESLLFGLDDYSGVYPIARILKEKSISVSEFHDDGDVKRYENYLFQTIITLIAESNKLVNSDFSNKDSFKFVYYNGISQIFMNLNKTMHLSYMEMVIESKILFNNLNLLKIAIFLPLIFYFLTGTMLFNFIEKINLQQWKFISGIPNKTWVIIRAKTVERIINMRKPILDIDYNISRTKAIYSPIWKKFILLYFILLAFILLYYLLLNYVIESSVRSIIDLKLSHRNWGGLRRSLTAMTFIFTRESCLDLNPSISYYDIIKDSQLFPSFELSVDEVTTNLINFQNQLLHQSKTLSQSFNRYNEYIEALIGNTCEVILTLTNCSESIVNTGISAALYTLISSSKLLVHGMSNIDWELLKQVENQANLVENAFVEANNLHSSISDSCIGVYMNAIIGSCIGIILIVIALHMLLKKESKAIETVLLSKNQFGLIFKDARIFALPSQVSAEIY